jgi:hypothetical protein
LEVAKNDQKISSISHLFLEKGLMDTGQICNIEKLGLFLSTPNFLPKKQSSTYKNIRYEPTSVADPDPGSGMGCLFDPWTRDPGWEKVSIRIRDPG